MNYQLNVTVGDGKYTVQQDDGGRLTALRYGEPWRDWCGDGLIYQLAAEVQNLREEFAESRSRARKLENFIKEYETKPSTQAALVISSQRDRLNELGKELDKALEELLLANKQIKKLEKAGDDMYYLLSNCNAAYEWHKAKKKSKHE